MAGAPKWGDGHVIVCGLKGLGFRTIEQLHHSGVPTVVVDDDPDPRLATIVDGWGVRRIASSAHLGEGLADADLERVSAVICVEDNELIALEIAMRVHEQRPDVRLVVRLANPSVARGVERVIGSGSVLDVASLAAPSFVEACLRNPAHEMELGGERFAVVQMTVGSEGARQPTFRSHFGNLAPVAVISSETDEMTCCPGRDHPVLPGDRVAVLGTPEDLARAGVDVSSAPESTAPRVSPAIRLRRLSSAVFHSDTRGLAIALASVLVLLLIATTVIHFAYIDQATHRHLSVLTSAYFTVETLATVGFGDFSFGGQSEWLQVFAIALIVVGVTLVTTSFALFTNLLVTRGIERSLGRRQVTGMSGHVVVVGLGSVGIRVVEGLLAEGRSVVVVESNAANRHVERARALGVPVIIADATQRQTHSAANLPAASAVAVLTSADLTNIEAGLAIRESLGDRWEDVPVVLRVFDRNLARTMERNFGFHHVRSTSALAAPRFIGAALGLDVLETFYVDQQAFLVGRLRIARSGGLQGLAMQDLSARTRVIALRRAGSEGALEHPPRRGTRFEGGDEAYLLGPYEELLLVLQRDQQAGT